MRVLFVCFHNSARSQMARAFFERLAPQHQAESAGVRPGAQIDPLVVRVMEERGIDLHGRTPRGLDANAARDADVVVRCIAPDPDDFEWPTGPAYLDWELPLPSDESNPKLEEVRTLRDVTEASVRSFVRMLDLFRVTRALSPLGISFGFCGGWALEIFAPSFIREHSDIDVALLRRDLDVVRRELTTTARSDHELVAERDGLQFEIVVNDSDGGDWVYRRDERVRLAIDGAFLATNPPTLAPEIVLLFKAKAPRPKDEADFAAIAPLLARERRSWLRNAIATAHGEGAWTRSLANG